MKKHQFILTIGVVLVGFVMPYLSFTLPGYDAPVAVGMWWSLIIMPAFSVYLTFTCGKYFRKLWYYPLAYAVVMLCTLPWDSLNYIDVDNVYYFGGIGLACILSSLFWGWFYKDIPKTE